MRLRDSDNLTKATKTVMRGAEDYNGILGTPKCYNHSSEYLQIKKIKGRLAGSIRGVRDY